MFEVTYGATGNVGSMRVIDLLVHSAPTIQAFDPYDGVQDQIPLTFADGMAFYSTGGMTIRQYMDSTGDSANAVAASLPNGIILGRNWHLRTSNGADPAVRGDVFITMRHELLHIALGLKDIEVAEYFGLKYSVASGQTVIEAAGHAISQWLAKDCSK